MQSKQEQLISKALGIKFKAHSNKDTDKDGVPDRLDCQPFNSKKHGVEPNLYVRQKISHIPIFVTQRILHQKTYDTLGLSYSQNKRNREGFIKYLEAYGVYPLLSKGAEIYAPHSRKIALSILKKYPELITEIKTTRPTVIFINSSYSRKYAAYAARPGSFVVIYGSNVLKYKSWKNYYKKRGISKPGLIFAGHVVRHELEHIRQYREMKGSKKEEKRLFGKEEYVEKRGEKKATQAAARMYKRHHREATEEDTEKGIESLFSEEK